MREIVAGDDREVLLADLTRARDARINLPGRVARTADLAEVRTASPTGPAPPPRSSRWPPSSTSTSPTSRSSHSAEGAEGVLILLVEAAQGDLFRGGLIAHGFRPSVRRLG